MNRLLTFICIVSLIWLIGCTQNPSEKPSFSSVSKTITTDTNIAYRTMSEGFRSPPNEVRTKAYWLWLNGQVTKESITKELEAMKSNGYGGAVICDALASGKNTDEVPH